MKYLKKINNVLIKVSLMVFVSLLIINIDVQADADENGILVEITKGKDSYSIDGKIQLNIKVTNTSNKNIDNLSIESILPKGLSSDYSNKLTFKKESLLANETTDIKLDLNKEILIFKNKNIVFILFLSVVLLVVLIKVIVINKKRKNIVGIILVGILTQMIIPINTISANAETINESYEVKENIIIDEENYDYTIKVSYNTFKEMKLTIQDEQENKLSQLIKEIFIINEPNPSSAISKGTISTLPLDDAGKLNLIYNLVCDHVIKENIKTEDSNYIISAEDLDNILIDSIGTGIENPNSDNLNRYKNGNYIFSIGDRGDISPFANINSILQVSEDTASIKGSVGYTINSGGVVNYEWNFEGTVKINKNSRFGNFTITDFNYTVTEETKNKIINYQLNRIQESIEQNSKDEAEKYIDQLNSEELTLKQSERINGFIDIISNEKAIMLEKERKKAENMNQDFTERKALDYLLESSRAESYAEGRNISEEEFYVNEKPIKYFKLTKDGTEEIIEISLNYDDMNYSYMVRSVVKDSISGSARATIDAGYISRDGTISGN